MEQSSQMAIGSLQSGGHPTSVRRRYRQTLLAVCIISLLICTTWLALSFAPVAHSAQGAATSTATAAPVVAAHLATTPTAVGTPDPVRVRMGTVAAPAGAASATVPLDLLVLTDRVNVGVVSAAVEYDPTLLTATGCTQSAAMDLLLCNVATPGVVQLAGVSALGVRGEATAAELTFDLVQTADRNVPLTVTVKRLGDGNGATVGATGIDGTIDLDCAPDAAICVRGTNIYLPLIRR